MNSMEERKIYYDNFKHEYTLTPDPLFEDVHRYASVYPGLKEDHYSEFYIGASLDRPYEDINMCFTYTNEDVANDEVGTKRGFCLKIFSYYYLASITLPPKEYTKTLIALLEENHIAVATTNTNISLVEEDIQKEARDENSIKQGEKSMYSKDVEQAILDGRATLASIVREAGTVQDKMDDAFAGAYRDGYEKAKEELTKDGDLDPEMVANIRNEAYECFKLLILLQCQGGLSYEEIAQIFGADSSTRVLLDKSITGDMVVKKINEYLDKKSKENNTEAEEIVFEVGDIVVDKTDKEICVINACDFIDGHGWYDIHSITNDKQYYSVDSTNYEFTGKNVKDIGKEYIDKYIGGESDV